MQLTLFHRPEDADTSVLNVSWKGQKRVGLDIETCDPYLKDTGPSVRTGGFIAGYSFAFEDGRSFYAPLRHSAGGNLPCPEQAMAYLKDKIKDFTGEFVGANLPYDLDYLMQDGVKFHSAAKFRDVQLAEPLIYELHQSYSLAAIAERHSLQGKDENELRQAASVYDVDPKSGLWQLPGSAVKEYAKWDALLPLRVYEKQRYWLDKHKLWEVFDLETEVLPILLDMRRRGVRIDQDRLAQVSEHSEREMNEALKRVVLDSGVQFSVDDLNATASKASLLRKIGVPVGKKMVFDKRRGVNVEKVSVDKFVLQASNHPVCKHLLEATKWNKIRNTFVESIKRHMVKGRIHCTFNQMAREDDAGDGTKGVRYGRMSAEHPNMQQQPARGGMAAFWRSIYVPEEGGLWASIDYSQQEPRWAMHFAHIAKCPGAEAAIEDFNRNPDIDSYTLLSKWTKVDRDPSKTTFLGISYGMGGAKLAKQLNLPTAKVMSERLGREIDVAGHEAQLIINQFNKAAPYVKALAKECIKLATKKHYIKTVMGRRLHFPNGEFSYKALNRLIQGSSADQTKKAMVDIYRAGHFLQLQVHDEVDTTVSHPDRAKEMSEIMRTCLPLTVPIKASVKVGKHWGECK